MQLSGQGVAMIGLPPEELADDVRHGDMVINTGPVLALAAACRHAVWMSSRERQVASEQCCLD